MPNTTYTSSPPPYRIPSGPSEGQRLVARWSSFSRLVKTGIVAGGLLSLVAAGAIAAPLVTNSEPSKHLPFGLTSEVPTSASAGNKVAEPSRPAATAPAAEPSKAPTSAAPSPTTKAPEPTKAPTTKAPEPTKATTTATEPVKTSTTPVPTTPAPTTPKPTTTTTTPKPTTTSPTAKPTVVAGATCTVAGATGVTSTGAAMVCKTSATDTTLRWRAA